MATVTLNKHHNTGIITINNPPVNALSQKVREDLVNCIKSAKLDTEILSIIIKCSVFLAWRNYFFICLFMV